MFTPIILVILKTLSKLEREVNIHNVRKGHLQNPTANVIITDEVLKAFDLKSEERHNACCHHLWLPLYWGY